jgi:FtsP/CotA-like multicopper oxidase with cupredoxin domain
MSPIRTLTLSVVATLAVSCGNWNPTKSTKVAPPPGPLDPATIPQFVTPLVIPPVMPPVAKDALSTTYEIAAVQFQQQVLPPPLPATTVWGYGKAGYPSTFNSPGFTVEVRQNELVRVKWVNRLVTAAEGFLPHLFPVDTTIHWANPMGMDMGADAYAGPVPITVHVHGAHVADHSDGNPDSWFLPAAIDTPAGYATQGSFYNSVVPTEAGSAVFEYANDQPGTTLWYHDHALGLTRLNVMAGLAGFWLIRDAVEDGLGLPGPAPQAGDAPGTRYYEIPIAIQDRAFKTDGSLAYPGSRADFDGYQGPFKPTSDVPPIWNPEVFGDAIMVNGRTWPYLEVEPRLYRFRLLNGCNARFLKLKLSEAGIPFHQIGGDGGLLPGAPVSSEQLLLAPAERADVLVDFSSLAVGTTLTMLNLGPDEPLKGPGVELAPANPATTGRIMQFRVVAATGGGIAGAIPSVLPPLPAPPTPVPAEREVTLNEVVAAALDIPVEAKLGTADLGGLEFSATATETPTVGTTEIWRIVNLTEDAHPIHLHLTMFQVLDRTPIDAEAYAAVQSAHLLAPSIVGIPDALAFASGPPTPPEPGEAGLKDTVIAYPGAVTRIIATFDKAGRYVWHCHILEHEDNEMMRPLVVVP